MISITSATVSFDSRPTLTVDDQVQNFESDDNGGFKEIKIDANTYAKLEQNTQTNKWEITLHTRNKYNDLSKYGVEVNGGYVSKIDKVVRGQVQTVENDQSAEKLSGTLKFNEEFASKFPTETPIQDLTTQSRLATQTDRLTTSIKQVNAMKTQAAKVKEAAEALQDHFDTNDIDDWDDDSVEDLVANLKDEVRKLRELWIQSGKDNAELSRVDDWQTVQEEIYDCLDPLFDDNDWDYQNTNELGNKVYTNDTLDDQRIEYDFLWEINYIDPNDYSKFSDANLAKKYGEVVHALKEGLADPDLGSKSLYSDHVNGVKGSIQNGVFVPSKAGQSKNSDKTELEFMLQDLEKLENEIAKDERDVENLKQADNTFDDTQNKEFHTTVKHLVDRFGHVGLSSLLRSIRIDNNSDFQRLRQSSRDNAMPSWITEANIGGSFDDSKEPALRLNAKSFIKQFKDGAEDRGALVKNLNYKQRFTRDLKILEAIYQAYDNHGKTHGTYSNEWNTIKAELDETITAYLEELGDNKDTKFLDLLDDNNIFSNEFKDYVNDLDDE